MPLLTSQDLTRMIRDGVPLMKATPAITQANFRLAINALGWANADWNLVETLIGVLGFTVPAPSFAQGRDYWVGTNNAQERSTRQALAVEFDENVLGKIASLTAQRDALQIQRNAVRDLIQNVLMPWINAPAVGTPAEVVDAVQERVQVLRNQRDTLSRIIDSLIASIAGLGG